MNNLNLSLRKFFITCAFALFATFICVGCGSKSASSEPKTFIDVDNEGKVFTANFDNTGKGTAGGSGLTIEDGEHLVVDTGLLEGKVHVKVISGGNDIDDTPTSDGYATIDYVFSGTGTTEYSEIQPGNYMVYVEVEEKASGTIDISVIVG